MGLINLSTNLKGLGFGGDVPGNGKSNEPYIQTQIPSTNEPLQTGFSLSGENVLSGLGTIAATTATGFIFGGPGSPTALLGAIAGFGVGLAGAINTNGLQVGFKAPQAGTGGPDFLLRGGTLLPNRIATDVERISKFFGDFSGAPKGLLFTLKQNLLSRAAVKTEGNRGALLNDGPYNPLSTIASVGGIALGGYFNKQGNNFTEGIGKPYVPNKYYDNVGSQLNTGIYLDNRLFQLYSTKILNDLSFNSSQNSILNTNILGGTDLSYNPFTIEVGNVNLLSYQGGPNSVLGIGTTNIKIVDGLQRTGVNNTYLANNLTQTDFNQASQKLSIAREQNNAKYPRVIYNNNLPKKYGDYLKGLQSSINGEVSVINDISTNVGPGTDTTTLAVIGQTYNNEQALTEAYANTPLGRATRGDSLKLREFEIVSTNKSFIGDRKADLRDYYRNLEADNYFAMTAEAKGNPDIIDFYISFFKNIDENLYFYFPAYIESFDDGFNAEWKADRFMGRGENFYTYTGFDRNISLSFKTYARNLSVMPLMYSNLNTIASSLAPKYNNGGFMTGNISKITLGEYIKDLPGVITNFRFNQIISPNSTWDVDAQLPYLFNVSMEFRPIHNFLPQFGNTFFGGDYNFDLHPMSRELFRPEELSPNETEIPFQGPTPINQRIPLA